MKKEVEAIVSQYLNIFPQEENRLKALKDFLNNSDDAAITDWNNFAGHIVASAFIYAKEEQKFLAVFHNEFQVYVYPGGHVDASDECILAAAKREVLEETGIKDYTIVNLCPKILVPIDIATHYIQYNSRLDLPAHYHYDFRYLFVLDHICDVVIAQNELNDYKWLSMDTLKEDKNFAEVLPKIQKLLVANNL